MRRKFTRHTPLRNGSRSHLPVLPALARGSAIFPHLVWASIGRSLRLSKRELQIVRGIFDDDTESAIGLHLGISQHTVHTHLERLRYKLAAGDRATLILQVIEEFLRLTGTAGSSLPPLCGWRAAGLCPRRD